MPHDIPVGLSALLDAPVGPRQEAAWEAFVREITPLLLHVARSYGGDHDAVMDRYAFILERLKADQYRRLRSWSRDRRSKLTTWLVIVAQRLSLDQDRQRYGRPRNESVEIVETRRTRRRLADLVAERLDHDGRLPSAATSDEPADTRLERAELNGHLARCVEALDASDQLLLTLRFQHGLSARQIARSLSFPTTFHVYRHLDRLLRGLKEQLRKRGVEDSLP